MFKTCNTCEYYNEPQYCRMHDARTLSTWTCPDYLGDEPRCTKCGSVLQEWQPKYGIYFCSYCKTSIQHPEWAKLKHDIDSKVHAQRLLDTNFGASADELLGKYKIDKEGNMKKEAIPKVWTDSNKATYWFEQHNEAQERIEDLEKLIKRHQAAFNDMKRKNEELLLSSCFPPCLFCISLITRLLMPRNSCLTAFVRVPCCLCHVSVSPIQGVVLRSYSMSRNICHTSVAILAEPNRILCILVHRLDSPGKSMLIMFVHRAFGSIEAHYSIRRCYKF